MKINTVSIVGCGWFGLPLAKALVKQGLAVSGSKRSAKDALALGLDNICGFVLDLDSTDGNQAQLNAKLRTDAIIINIPPSIRKSPGAYIRRLKQLKHLIADHQYQKLIFISTTGVYPSSEKLVTEQDAQAHSEASEVLLQAESLFNQASNACVIRFAGLVGPARHPGRFLAGKTELAGADSPVNIVHLDDCVAAVACVLSSGKVSDTYNLCAPSHPTRKEFYTKMAQSLSLVEPEFGDTEQAGKVIDGSKISTELGFEYQHQDPMKISFTC
ncbi:SDR family oxidoreductase [Shewanella nanhaiensis]|uniref:SDR family oxidoreductase n=1 Tax=Shewanella nanhaiensis TaxID=2864872 RepID=A0ABS7DXA5_9GAMM|nr:SDR family oxidoreductase [Shewanella nanhaiensis]MBW8182062.1 SDR family oxidoreductase [Shewanella nanhaiensis]